VTIKTKQTFLCKLFVSGLSKNYEYITINIVCGSEMLCQPLSPGNCFLVIKITKNSTGINEELRFDSPFID
jgi:hypothetical protein